MDFIQILLGRYLLDFFGALFRFFFINIGGLMGFNNYTTFSDVWTVKGSLDKKNGNSEKNHMIGVIIFGIIIVLLIIFMT